MPLAMWHPLCLHLSIQASTTAGRGVQHQSSPVGLVEGVLCMEESSPGCPAEGAVWGAPGGAAGPGGGAGPVAAGPHRGGAAAARRLCGAAKSGPPPVLRRHRLAKGLPPPPPPPPLREVGGGGGGVGGAPCLVPPRLIIEDAEAGPIWTFPVRCGCAVFVPAAFRSTARTDQICVRLGGGGGHYVALRAVHMSVTVQGATSGGVEAPVAAQASSQARVVHSGVSRLGPPPAGVRVLHVQGRR